ncbi:Cof-type HAD-IIB family hydrolase [Aureibacillus halotolerans]|uniref:Cof subfamily protein (Haloacid dehalogenase superfamily)/HAD superfamily hydrolase (TIGR01484 family) n=1 Tax=Aureibacillus halotolerans TaxID=1508390 RepID=A0A4R6TRS6_9BACI|nr:Cof-type HAD-IIB family hydrolase [Aureibacillus halotolerans]TDQ35402.1 hypothetical protein EV213_12119 [Aureibacillus halotolerans]
MVYRLLALNVDGTLLKSNGRLTKQTKEAVQYVRDKGVHVTLVTNRHFLSARKVAKALKIPEDLITHGGAYVSKDTEFPVVNRRLNSDIIFGVVQILETFKCSIRLMHEKYAIGNSHPSKPQLVSKTVFGLGDPVMYPIQFVESLGDHVRDHPLDCPKVDCHFYDDHVLEKAEDYIASAFPELTIIKEGKHHLSILPSGVNKAYGLQQLARMLEVPAAEIVAIGDDASDMGMIRFAGVGVSMGNAPFEVKKASDWITRSNDENGVAYMIKELFRKQLDTSFVHSLTLRK